MTPPDETMEKLSLKFSSKSWDTTRNIVELSMGQPPHPASSDTSDSSIRTCLERLQRVLNESLPTVMNTLEGLAKEKGLNYHVSPNGAICYMTSESFYIEIHLAVDGEVVDVKLAHPGKSPRNCEDLLQLLRVKNFTAFGKILEDLLSIHQTPGSSGITKASGFVALQSLEKDLGLLSALHKNRTPDMDRVTEVLNGKVGYLTPSSRGTAMSLEYYLSQYQILDEQIEGLKMQGRKVFVTLKGTDTSYRLPLAPLIVSSLTDEDRHEDLPETQTVASPKFLQLTEVPCKTLSACFFLTFPEPFPMSVANINKLQELTGIPIQGMETASLHKLIVDFALSEMHMSHLGSHSRFFVSLSGCLQQTYFINKDTEKPRVTGAMVREVPFTHPKDVPEMIEVLRQQAAYNTLVGSCISDQTECEDPSDLLHFEISQETATSFSVTFVHPLKESLACVLIDVISSREFQCKLYPTSDNGLINCSNDFLARVVKICTSVPLLMRTIYKRASTQKSDEAAQTS